MSSAADEGGERDEVPGALWGKRAARMLRRSGGRRSAERRCCVTAWERSLEGVC